MKLRYILFELVKPKLPYGKWVQASESDLKAFREEIFDLIKRTYAYIGGHHDFKSPDDITTSVADYWIYADVDRDNDPDVVLAAKTTKAGKKFVVGANDGSTSASTFLVYSQIDKLKKPGFYAEISHKIADILIARGVPVINDEKKVREILNKDIEWIGKIPGHEGDGWYYRMIDGKKVSKIMLGKPKI